MGCFPSAEIAGVSNPNWSTHYLLDNLVITIHKTAHAYRP